MQSLLIFSGAALLWGALFWSGGRGAMASLMVSFILASIILPGIALRLWGFVLATVPVGAGLSLLVWTPLSSSFGLMGFFVRSTGEGVTSGRIDMWKDIFTLFLDKPIFGYGNAQYHLHTQIEAFKSFPQVHNFILDALLSFGLVGGLCLLYLAFKAWLKVVIKTKIEGISYRFPAFLGLNTLLAHSMLTGTYYYIHGQIYIAILFGLLLADIRKPDRFTNA
ncbi:MAG: O-antigen ligase family protein [Paracoccaceae bacterium]